LTSESPKYELIRIVNGSATIYAFVSGHDDAYAEYTVFFGGEEITLISPPRYSEYPRYFYWLWGFNTKELQWA